MSSNPSSRQTALVVGCCAAVIAAACARRAAAAAARAARQRPSSHHQTGVLLDGSDLGSAENLARIAASRARSAAKKAANAQKQKRKKGGDGGGSAVGGGAAAAAREASGAAATAVAADQAAGDPADQAIAMRPIGFLDSCFRAKRGCPRQSGLCPEARASLTLAPGISGHSLDGLEGYSHVWLLWVFHENTSPAETKGHRTSAKAKIAPPKMGGAKVGLFATRTPHRPNPVGLSLVRLDRVEVRDDGRVGRLHFRGADLVDGTPVLDVKPYLRHFECVPDAREPAWVHASGEEGVGGGKPVSFTPAVEAALPALLRHTRFYQEGDDDAGAAEGRGAAAASLTAAVAQMLALDMRSGAAAARAKKRRAGGESAATTTAGGGAGEETEGGAVVGAEGGAGVGVDKAMCFGFDGLQFLCRERDGGFEVFEANKKKAEATSVSNDVAGHNPGKGHALVL
jgi:tRNA-Thr(GGU) m(6)t(6)A37 methyltransferase TsaA